MKEIKRQFCTGGKKITGSLVVTNEHGSHRHRCGDDAEWQRRKFVTKPRIMEVICQKVDQVVMAVVMLVRVAKVVAAVGALVAAQGRAVIEPLTSE